MPRANLLFGLSAHWREPQHGSVLRFVTGWVTAIRKDNGVAERQAYGSAHVLRGMTGLAFKDRWFFGAMTFSETIDLHKANKREGDPDAR